MKKKTKESTPDLSVELTYALNSLSRFGHLEKPSKEAQAAQSELAAVLDNAASEIAEKRTALQKAISKGEK